MPNVLPFARTLLVPVTLLVVSCASGSADLPSPRPVHETTASASSAVSVSPMASAEGIAFDDPPLMSNSPTGDVFGARPTFDGSRYFFTWKDFAHGDAVFGSYVAEIGSQPAERTLLAPPPPPRTSYELIDSASSSLGGVALWLVRDTTFFNQATGIAGARVLPGGTVGRFEIADAVAAFTSPDGNVQSIYSPGVLAADASAFHVLYYRANPTGGVDLVYRRLNQTGEPGAPTTILSKLPISLTGGAATTLSLVSNGQTLFASWQGYDATGTTFAPARYFTLSIAAPAPATIRTYDAGGAHYLRAVAPTTDGFRAFAYSGEARVVSFDSSGDVTSPGTTVPNDPSSYLINVTHTTDPNVFLASIARSDDSKCIQRISTVGLVGPCTAFTLASDRGSSDAFGTRALAVGNTTLLEMFPQNSNVFGKAARYPLSNFNAPETVTISTLRVNEEAPSIATDGVGYLMVWRDTRVSNGDVERTSVVAQRLDAEGKPAGTQVQISSKFVGASPPSVIFDGTKFVVAWAERTDQSDSNTHIMIALLPPSGELKVEKTIDVGVTTLYSGFLQFGAFSISSDRINRTLVWMGTAGGAVGIYGARVAIDNDSLVDTTPVLLARGVGYTFPVGPHIVFGGKRSLVVWVDFSYLTAGVAAAFIEPGKMELSGAPFPLLNTGTYIVGSNVVASDADTYFVTAQQFASEAGGMGLRGAYVTSQGKVAGYSSAGKWVEDDSTATIPLAPDGTSSEDIAMTYAKDKVNFVAVWSGRSGDEQDVNGAWIDPRTGYVRDRDGVSIAARANVIERIPTVSILRDGKGVVAYQEYVESEGAFRIRTRALSSGNLMGAQCKANEECGTRECVDGVCCESACNDGCGTCSAVPGTCTPKAKGASCGAGNVFACSGETTACPSVCASNDQCVSNRCTKGVCEIPSVRCVDDFHLSDATGNITDCGDYKCSANACRNPCRDVADCKEGLVCTFEGACALPPPLQTAADGCSMSERRMKTFGSGAFSVGVLGLIAVGIVRRRSSRSKGDAQ